MSNTQYFWSEQARMEFAALFDDGSHSESFREAVASALARGWGNNRDKPFWAMSMLVAILGQTGSTGGGDEGLDLVWTSPAEILARLQDIAQQPDTGAKSSGAVIAGDDGLFLEMPDGRLKLGVMRIAILGKLAEFLLAANEFAFSAEVMEILSDIATNGPEKPAVIRDGGRALARLAYKYRAEHFRDAHSASSFSIIRTWLAKRDDFRIDDEALFSFWVWPDNTHFKTYATVYFAFSDFQEALEEARIIEASTSAVELDDPVIAGELARIDEDIFASVREELSPEDRIALINESELKLFKKTEINTLKQLFECGTFGLSHGLSSLRLLSFNAIQSGISNGLRTGRSKIPLEQRVLCTEARSYNELIAELGALQKKSQGWLKVALALRQQDTEQKEEDSQIYEEGISILKHSRSKSLSQDHEILRPLFAQMEESLIKCAEQARVYTERLQQISGPDGKKGDELFENDRQLFAAEFQRRYLTQENTNI